MQLHLFPLGTNGFFPSFGRQTMGFLLRWEDEALLLDAGSGLGRLMEPGPRAALDSAERLTVVLTHYHLDHVIGLPSLSASWKRGSITLYAPAPPLVDGQPETAMDHLFGRPLFPHSLRELQVRVELTPYTNETLTVGGLTIRTRRQTHPGGSVGLRVGEHLAYCTDTVADPETADLARGVDLLMHEVWLTDDEAAATDPGPAGHSYAHQVARIAEQAGTKRLAPVHHHPKRDAAGLQSIVHDLHSDGPTPVVLLEEGSSYEVS